MRVSLQISGGVRGRLADGPTGGLYTLFSGTGTAAAPLS